ncbi:triose-phosphate transporter family-domain-containing protein [Gamsiella multidivaricata]|uniref:triose-phosphate transporter family-domain-containing protein n=1 Tax=Gamsiella multidivaricata TaxID=101098 RepID=UPI0022208929|nr:triose-phosphate transporter family-domain-containing protein [Gamsiella multidivaricata]KAI7821361.1 triose-phosphate transporter family-domain-containing protein [Gamsiella multidivaricata]
MVDSLESSSALSRTTETTVTHVNGNSIQGTSILEVRNGQDPGRGRGFHRSDNVSDSDSSSSDDGIEWDNSGYYTSEHTSEDDGGDGYSSDDDAEDESDGAYDEQDRQRLLASSSKVRVGGMGVGMRVGETGTGTTIGLDFERDNIQNDGDYDVLPLMNVGSNLSRQRRKGKSGGDGIGGRRERSRRGSQRNQRRSLHTVVPVLGQGAIRTEQEQSIVKRQLRIEMFWNVFYVFAWYGCSTSLSFYNKWLFSPLHYNFRFPLFTTCLHMVAEFVLASLTLIMIPSLRPSAAPSVKDFGTKIMPCAVASGLDIGLSNNSLKSITLAFYTMCKSSSLAFVLLFAFAFKLERPTWTLAGVIGVICVGLFMMVMSEADFVLIGFIQVMLASVLGGLRWSLTQLLLERTDTKSGSLANPISTIFFLSPIMGICLCIVAGMFEGYGDIFRSEFFSTVGSSFGTLSLLFLGGIFAFTMIVAEFNLIARTSVVSLSVLGIIKEVVTIVISSLVFHDRLTIINILGLVVTLSGIGFYHYMKLHELKSRARRAAKEIMELNSASSTNRIDRSVDLAPFQDYRRKRHSGRSKGRSGHRSLREEARNNVEIEGRRAGSSEGLYGRELMGPNGAEQTVGRSQLIRDLDGTSPTNLNSS